MLYIYVYILYIYVYIYIYIYTHLLYYRRGIRGIILVKNEVSQLFLDETVVKEISQFTFLHCMLVKVCKYPSCTPLLHASIAFEFFTFL